MANFISYVYSITSWKIFDGKGNPIEKFKYKKWFWLAEDLDYGWVALYWISENNNWKIFFCKRDILIRNEVYRIKDKLEFKFKKDFLNYKAWEIITLKEVISITWIVWGIRIKENLFINLK